MFEFIGFRVIWSLKFEILDIPIDNSYKIVTVHILGHFRTEHLLCQIVQFYNIYIRLRLDTLIKNKVLCEHFPQYIIGFYICIRHTNIKLVILLLTRNIKGLSNYSNDFEMSIVD